MGIDKMDAPADIIQLTNGRPITNLMFLIWQSRKDLRLAFDYQTQTGQEGFIGWYDAVVEREYGISSTAVTGSTKKGLTCKEKNGASFYIQVSHLLHHLSRSGRWIPTAAREKLKLLCFQLLKYVARFSTRPAVGIKNDVAVSGDCSAIAEQLKSSGDPGVNLVGYVHAELGMGEHVRMSATALAETDVKNGVINFDVGVPSRQQAQLNRGIIISSNIYRANLFHINADQMLTAFCHLGRNFFTNRYNIGYWLWELSRCPDEWLPVMGLVDEIWAPSRFIQQAFAERTDLPVVHMPLCVKLPPLKGYHRSHFSLPDDRFLFLFAFDFFSYVDRKNPFAIIQAFKQAFPNRSTKVGLVIKIMNGNSSHSRWKDMYDMINDDPRVFVLNKVMSRDEVIGLMNVCDSFVSLHRSEGFGFGPAESMYLGKPVIVTNYSGNTDFTLPDNSCLVNYSLIPVVEGQYVFYNQGQVWADPDIEHAAWYMQKLVEDSSYGSEIGKKAAAFIRANHSPARVGALYQQRLKELNLV